METKTPKTIVEIFSSSWLFVFTLLLFAVESGWLALTSRFPMAFDEAYHFGLIQFFSHRLNPIVTSQPASTYRFGAIVQGPSFLYHYLLSFPYRFIELFTKSPEIQVIGLRFINVALAIGGLLIMRRLLKLLHVSDGLANIVMLAFALTPIVTVLSAQINYDNLLIPAVTLCVYEAVLFTQKLEQKVFDTKALLVLLCLCLFSSLIKFAFLPVFLALAIVVMWRVIVYSRRHGVHLLITGAKKGLARMRTVSKLVLLTVAVLGSLLFGQFYGVNMVRYHNPEPPCDQVLNPQDCRHYYSWNRNHALAQYKQTHPVENRMSIPHYSAYWLMVTSPYLFGATLPLKGPYYVSQTFYVIVGLLADIALVCVAVNFRKMLRNNRDLSTIVIVSFVYLLALWARNYHDYVHLGQPVAIDGRYWVPVLAYLYVLSGLGIAYALAVIRKPRLIVKIKTGLGVLVIFVFVHYGGYMQYISHITPVYGRISPSNNFVLPDNP